MSDITAKIFHQEANRTRFTEQKAGWVVYDPETGNNLDNRVFATADEATAAIPAILAGIATRRADREERDAQKAAATEQAAIDRSFTTLRSSFYGSGRRYHDQPGATQYEDGFGGYNVQIWDES